MRKGRARLRVERKESYFLSISVLLYKPSPTKFFPQFLVKILNLRHQYHDDFLALSPLSGLVREQFFVFEVCYQKVKDPINTLKKHEKFGREQQTNPLYYGCHHCQIERPIYVHTHSLLTQTNSFALFLPSICLSILFI